MKTVRGRCPISGAGISMNVRSVQEAERERVQQQDRNADHYLFLKKPCLANFITGERIERKIKSGESSGIERTFGNGEPSNIIPFATEGNVNNGNINGDNITGENIMKNLIILLTIIACGAGLTGCSGTTSIKDASNTTTYSQHGVTVSTSGSAGEIDHSVQ